MGEFRSALSRLACFMALCLGTVSGCSMRAPISDSPSTGEILESTAGSEPERSPFTLEILDEVNDGERVSIRGRIVPKADWSRDDVVLRLSALDELGDSKIVLRKLSDIAPKGEGLSANKPTEFVLSIPSVGISNYQIELLWGDEAAPFMARATESLSGDGQILALRKLEVHRIPSDSCATPDECSVKFTITGEFFNSGGATLKNVVIEAGFSPADKLDLPSQILENARRIEVRNLNLMPGGTKPFRLALEKLIPSSEQIAPRPVVRIVSVEPA
jgi:hypothetical protein